MGSGYYRCKKKHAEVYDELLTLYKSCITEEALKMLAHPYSTQSNEAINKSVSCFAPKAKTFLRTENLDTWLGIAAGIQVLGYEVFWDEVFHKFDLVMDDELRTFLRNLKKKGGKRRRELHEPRNVNHRGAINGIESCRKS